MNVESLHRIIQQGNCDGIACYNCHFYSKRKDRLCSLGNGVSRFTGESGFYTLADNVVKEAHKALREDKLKRILK